ncbi:molybdate transporter 1 [Forsythia ovata]|uniref:Molybdate transporter 1 n=1 Tax=Forsythia ovata TaxID=205694 RepID=A0ABD1UV04_9LAMI
MNLIGCWFGATPCCYSAGGIAGQYKFGGMSGWCVALLGIAKLVLGLGSSLVKILDQFHVGVLGVLLLFAGIELAMCSRDMNSKEESVVMLICTLNVVEGSRVDVWMKAIVKMTVDLSKRLIVQLSVEKRFLSKYSSNVH